MASGFLSRSSREEDAAADAAPGVTVQRVQITENVYQFTAGPDGCTPNGNSVVFVNENDVLVLDTFARPSTARTLLAEIQDITDKPVRYVVNSHHHPDHWSGNEVFADKFPEVVIITTEETRRLMLNIANAWPAFFAEELRKLQAGLDKDLIAAKAGNGNASTPEWLRKDLEEFRQRREFVAEVSKVKRTYPTVTYGETMTLRCGSREFCLMSMVGDASGTTVLYLPEESMLVTGDLLSSPVPNFGAFLGRHLESLRKLGEMEAELIIPGHGPAFHDKVFLNLEADLLDSVVNQVVRAVQRGSVTEEDIERAVDVEPFRTRFTHGDAELNERFRRYVKRMVGNASYEARGGRLQANSFPLQEERRRFRR
jgi:cyclase